MRRIRCLLDETLESIVLGLLLAGCSFLGICDNVGGAVPESGAGAVDTRSRRWLLDSEDTGVDFAV
jgi:hypothetical protein